MAELEFRFLGPLEVRRDGALVPVPPGLPRTLLARLLVAVDTVVPTDRLVDDLWRGDPPASAGHALRVYVSNLRRLLEPDRAPGIAPGVLITRRPGYLLSVPGDRTDAGRFEGLVAEGTQAFSAGRVADASTAFTAALGLWRGALLADLVDEPFVEAEAARLGELRWVAVERWAEAELALGRHAELVGELEALIRERPFQEGLWAQLIVALYRAGRQADALATYQRLRTLLVEERGLEPSPPLRQLEAAVLRHDPELAVPAAIPAAAAATVTQPEDGRFRASAPPAAERTPFVGREPELAELDRLLDQAVAGTGGLLLVGGEPGVGKSRFVEEVAARARGRFRVLTGHCYESGRDAPYLPWVEMIEAAMEALPPDELRRAYGDEAPEFARLVPALRRVLPDIPPPVELPPEQQRRYTFNSIRDFLYRVAREQPRLYIIEDLHWADEATLLLLEHVLERLSSVPCLIVGTFRDPPLDISPQLAETQERLVRRRQAGLLSLKRHSEPEVESLLAAMSGQAPPPGIRAAVYEETAGNAFFVEEVYRHFTESGRLLDGRGRFRDDIDIGELDVPSNVRLVTGQRLARLSTPTQQLLGVAAVAGRHVTFELLEAIADLKGDDLIDALDEAERAGVIFTEPGTGDEEYWFAHELTRQTILARLPAARRRRHHLRVAEALERLNAADVASHAATIAQHLSQAGSSVDRARLFRYLVLAGTRALDSAAAGDALRHLHRAAELADHAGAAEQAELWFQLGMAERGAGRFADALPPWLRAVEIYEQLGDRDAVGRVCLAAAYNLAWAGQLAESVEMALRGVAALGDRRSGDRCRLAALAGAMIAGGGDYEAGMQAVEDALSMAEELGDDGALGYGLFWKTIGHVVLMEMRDAVATGERAAEILRSVGDLWALAGTLGFLAEALVSVGDFDRAAAVEREVAPLAERLGNVGATWHSVMVQGALTFCRTGDLDGLETIARREIELCEEAGMGWASWGWSWLSLVELLRGNGAAAIAHGEKAEALAAPTTMRGLEWAVHFEARAFAGQHDEARTLLERGGPELPRVGEPAGWGPWVMLVSAVEGLVALGEHAEAAALYPAVVHCRDRTGVVDAYPNDCKLVERIAGLAAAAGANWDAAEAHYTTALRQAAELPHLPEQARTRRCYAAMLSERGAPGDKERAAALLSEADELARRLGFNPGDSPRGTRSP